MYVSQILYIYIYIYIYCLYIYIYYSFQGLSAGLSLSRASSSSLLMGKKPYPIQPHNPTAPLNMPSTPTPTHTPKLTRTNADKTNMPRGAGATNMSAQQNNHFPTLIFQRCPPLTAHAAQCDALGRKGGRSIDALNRLTRSPWVCPNNMCIYIYIYIYLYNRFVCN